MFFKIIKKLHKHKWSSRSLGRFCRRCNLTWKTYISYCTLPEQPDNDKQCVDCASYPYCWGILIPSEYNAVQEHFRTECIERKQLLWRSHSVMGDERLKGC